MRPILKKIGIGVAIPILSFLAMFCLIDLYFRYSHYRLDIVEDEIPKVLQDLGLTVQIEPYGDETEAFRFSYQQATEQWLRNYDLWNFFGPTFIAAQLDQDTQPEIILINGYYEPIFDQAGRYQSSWQQLSPRCSTRSNPNNALLIQNNFVVYDLENETLLKSCQVPAIYAPYLTERYRSWILTPHLLISMYFSLLSSVVACGIYLWRRKGQSTVTAEKII